MLSTASTLSMLHAMCGNFTSKCTSTRSPWVELTNSSSTVRICGWRRRCGVSGAGRARALLGGTHRARRRQLREAQDDNQQERRHGRRRAGQGLGAELIQRLGEGVQPLEAVHGAGRCSKREARDNSRAGARARRANSVLTRREMMGARRASYVVAPALGRSSRLADVRQTSRVSRLASRGSVFGGALRRLLTFETVGGGRQTSKMGARRSSCACAGAITSPLAHAFKRPATRRPPSLATHGGT